MGLKILLAEDEAALARVYAAALTHQGFTVTHVPNGREAVNAARSSVYDVYLFDVMMPELSGVEALRTLRESGDRTYAILLTAMSEIEDKVTGLDAGADDYLTKPISLKELLARMASLDRRLGTFTENILTFSGVTLNVAQQELTATNSIRLAGKEAKLMELLILNQGRELSTQEIFNQVWAKDEDPDMDEGYVYIYISYLRQKLRSVQAAVEITGTDGGSYQLRRAGDDHAS